MKNYYLKFIMGVIGMLSLYSCGELDYENKEFYTQEVYLINSESTAASERTISNVAAYTYEDTLRVLNDDYDTELVKDARPGVAYVKYKIGIGGSLPAKEDIVVKIGFDPEAVADYNIERNTDLYIPDRSLFTTNVPYNESEGAYSVTIPKGESSTALIFSIPLVRDLQSEYTKFAFSIKILSCDNAPLSRQYTQFLVASLVINATQTTDWSGYPIPRIQEGRYHSSRLQSNGAENTSNGIHRMYKYITRLGDTPDLVNKYVVWGTSVWAFENQGLHSSGWMYNLLSLNDEVRGTYTLEPIMAGNPDFPIRTFTYTSVFQKPSYNNKYDPKTKTMTLYYIDVAQVGNNQTDVLTFVGDDKVYGEGYTMWTWPNTVGGGNFPVTNWEQVRSRGYKYWLPIESENE
jgi:hypothetical protein